MLRYLQARDLAQYPALAQSMFADRAAQFHDRLQWDVSVDGEGAERDEYDALDPFYVIWETRGGRHGGSLRFLPTTGPTMIADHFPHLTDGVRVASPFIWETTRFCISPTAPARVSAALMLGGLELGLAFGLSHAVGIFDARMVRLYRALGWPPAIFGTRDGISAGLWAFDADIRPVLLRRAGISSEVSALWVRRGLAPPLARTG